MWTQINWRPGVHLDDSPIDAEGYFIDADKIRFVRGLPQTFAGWERFSTTTFSGICRGLFTWADFAGTKYLGVGTHLRAYAYDLDGTQYDITPVDVARSDEGRGTLAAVVTTSGDATVTVHFTAHGMVDEQAISFPGSSTANSATLTGLHSVTKVDDDTITFESTSTAASTGTALTTVDYEVHIAPGQIDGLAALGYGTGPYSGGGYGSPTSGYTLYPRTWSMSQWGQNLLIHPRGGSIYEWSPNVTSIELVTDGNFDGSGTAWTTGTNWSVAGTAAVATAGAAGNLSQSITLNQNSWNLLDFDATVTAGTCAVYVGTSTVLTFSATGTYKTPFYSNAGGAQTLSFNKESAFAGEIDNLSVKLILSAHRVPNAPTNAYSSFVTAEGILVCLGANDSNGNFDPLLVKWSDTWGGGGSNDFSANQTWTSTNANAAGDKRLSKGTRIVHGCPVGGANLIWTDTTLYVMRFVPDPSIVYRFDELTDVGLVGPNAFTVSDDGSVKWMAPDGSWYVYIGGQVQPMNNTMRRYVWDNLSKVQGDKIFGSSISIYDDDIWFYPDQRDGNECSRYTMRNPGDIWVNGTFDRTAFIDAGVFAYPISADTSGQLWYQEKGDSVDGGTFSYHIEAAYQGQAGAHVIINGLRPDAEDLKGGYSVTITGQNRDSRGIGTRTIGPAPVTASTGKVSFRIASEKVKIKWSGASAPAFWRMGQNEFDVMLTGRRR